jgi:hypothetical protein
VARTQFVHLVNRTTGPLDCMWDGVPIVAKPGYRAETRPLMDPSNPEVQLLGKDKKPRTETVYIPLDSHGRDLPLGSEPEGQQVEVAEAEGCVRQHPIMGTADPNSVDARDTDYLLGVREWGHELSYIEQSDAIELLDRSLLSEDRQNVVVRNVSGARRKVTPADVTNKKISENKRRDRMMSRSQIVDPRLINPAGIRIEGQIAPGEPR